MVWEGGDSRRPEVSEPTPRQVLYALVAVGFLAIVVVLTIGASVAGLTPDWWTWTMVGLVVVVGAWSGFNWKRTGPILLLSIGLFIAWTIGTLIVS